MELTESSSTRRFSIIIPCFNHGRYLVQAVMSVMQQTYNNWEVIIVDDGSTDDTLITANKLAKDDSRIQVLSKANGGLSSARNFGLPVATGDYLQFLDADDFQLPGCLEAVNKSIGESNSLLIRGGYQYVDDINLSILHYTKPPRIGEPVSYVLRKNLGPCHSIFVSRRLANRLGGFDETLRSVEDWDFWIRAVKAGGTITTINVPLVAYRYVNNSMSRDAFTMYSALKTVTIRAPKKDTRIQGESPLNIDYNIEVNPILKRHLLMCLGVCLMQGKVDEAIKLFKDEVVKNEFTLCPEEFSIMCSPLSFRYLKSKEDLKTVMTDYRPKFEEFFKGLDMKIADRKIAMRKVFAHHHKMANHKKYGPLIGSILNKIQYW